MVQIDLRTRTPGKSYTIRDVARLARVSVATVSAVINNKDIVRPELKRRVQEAMAALDYHPDHVARSLRVRRSQTIGMVIPDVTNPFFTDVMRGVEDVASQNGYSVILCNADENPEQERRCLSNLFSRRVDGVLLAPTDMHAAEDRLTKRRFPMVFFDRVPPGFKGAAVTTDSFDAAYEATRHLIELGHRRIAIITGRLDLSNGRDRLEGFRKAMQEAHLPIRDEYVPRGDFRLESGYRCARELMQLHAPPTAIFSCNNKMTLGLMRALAELSIPCPQRVSVFGFDDFDWSAAFNPRLTTVAQHTFEMGKRAMEMLLKKMKPVNEDSEPEEESIVVLKAELRLRDSTAPPSPDDWGSGS
jgi:LacI family transcriptional regulator, galactose operon repressor